MKTHDYTTPWAARLAAPTDAELAILRAVEAAPRRPETTEAFSEALWHIRALWTGPAPEEAPEADVVIPEGIEADPEFVGAAEFREAVGETVQAARGNGRR